MHRFTWVLVALLLGAGVAGSLHAAAVYNTGVCGGANPPCSSPGLLADNALDNNWEYVTSSSYSSITGLPTLPPLASYSNETPYTVPPLPGLWLAEDGASRWDSPVPAVNGVVGNVTVSPSTGDLWIAESTFTITSAGLNINVVEDDELLAVVVNGMNVLPSECTSNCFVTWDSAVLGAPGKIDLYIQDNANNTPTGFRAEFSPEPATWVLVLTGLGAIPVVRRKWCGARGRATS